MSSPLKPGMSSNSTLPVSNCGSISSLIPSIVAKRREGIMKLGNPLGSSCIRAGKKPLSMRQGSPYPCCRETSIRPARKPISMRQGSAHPSGKDVRILTARKPHQCSKEDRTCAARKLVSVQPYIRGKEVHIHAAREHVSVWHKARIRPARKPVFVQQGSLHQCAIEACILGARKSISVRKGPCIRAAGSLIIICASGAAVKTLSRNK